MTAALLVAAGNNPERLKSEAAFAQFSQPLRSVFPTTPIEGSVIDVLVAFDALPGHMQSVIESGECRTSAAIRSGNGPM